MVHYMARAYPLEGLYDLGLSKAKQGYCIYRVRVKRGDRKKRVAWGSARAGLAMKKGAGKKGAGSVGEILFFALQFSFCYGSV